jgi:hypothetical protein
LRYARANVAGAFGHSATIKGHTMKNRIRTTVRIGTAVLALALASTSYAQVTSPPLTAEQLAERRAAAQQRAEESIRYLNELMAKA